MNLNYLIKRMYHSSNGLPLLLAFVYAVGAALWILVSGHLLSQFKDPDLIHQLERVKGLAFVFVTAGLLFFLLRSWYRRIKVSHDQLKATLDTIPDLLFEVDLEGRYYDYHSPYTDLLAAPPDRLLGKTVKEILPPNAAAVCLEALQEAHDKGSSHGRQFELALEGETKWFELSVSAKSAPQEGKPRFIVLSRDITERKINEEKIIRLSRLYAALSQCNQAIVRCKDEQELFSLICQDAVTFGDIQMSWIGVADETDQCLKPVAFFGNGIEYLEGLRISIDAADPSAHGPSGTVFREDRPFWCQDFQHDPATAMWHEKGVRFGWGSSAALPLHRNGKVIGTLNLYSDKVNAFDKISQTLILEMISDIDYAIANFERERRQQEIETELLKRSQAIEQSSNAIIITDFKANIEYVNASFVETTGYLPSEVIGKNPRLLQSGKTPPHAYDDMWEHLTRQETWHGEFVNRRKDGSDYVYSINVSPVLDNEGKTTHYIAIEEDITEQKRSAQRIHYLANFDVLTGLPNRIQLNDHFQYTLNLAKRSQRKFAVMFLDLDHFKTINDTLGHSYGDALLIQVAASLQSILREEDTISRLGGDEFILLIPDTDTNGAAQVAQKLLEIVSKPFFIEQHELTITASIGIALYPTDGVDMEVLSKNADAAMYRAKKEGRNGYRFFTDEMQERSVRNLQLSNALHHAMEREELYLVYQPQISLRNGQIIGAEALLRWEHPELGNIPPAEFIPVAEDSGLILSIGEWVLRAASQQMQRWMENGMKPIIMAVNLSAVQFRHANLPDLVTQILNEVGLPPEYLELELTEGMAMLDPISAIGVMNDLHSRGVRMSVDDFGTGYSSLSYLKKFKVYKLKIDQSFVRDISVDSEDKAIVSAIISMAKQLGLQTIAEGVETIEQLNYLHEQGCDEIQGYHYSKPLLPEAFEAFSKKRLKISR